MRLIAAIILGLACLVPAILFLARLGLVLIKKALEIIHKDY